MSEIFDELARKCLTGGRGLHLDVFFSLPDGIFSSCSSGKKPRNCCRKVVCFISVRVGGGRLNAKIFNSRISTGASFDLPDSVLLLEKNTSNV
jgi:hypothetical protein